MQQQLIIGTLLHGGTYKIEKILGQGSFGITYLAEHTNLGKKVAIKEFFMKELNSRGEDGSITGMSDSSLSQNYCQKFKKEAISLSRLDHPNIVRVTDSFSENGTFYYVMDYIEGENLNEYVKHNHVSQQEAIEIIRDVADALIYMHEEKHMLHLDLKPGNVMRRNSDGHIFLIDFGLSKHYSTDGQPETPTTIGLGTPGYAPIEQANQAKNGEFRPTIDVYALGATFYKLLTCETPPAASELVSDDELLENKLREKGVSDNLIKVVAEAMCPNVKKRTQNVKDFLASLQYTVASDNADDTYVDYSNEDETVNILSKTDETIVEGSTDKDEQEEDDDEDNTYGIFSFKGRIGRFEYLLSLVAYYLAFIGLLAVCSFLLNDQMMLIVGIGISIIFYWIMFAVGAKRCHDIGRSGWYQLIPFYGLVMLFYEGENDNDYGKAHGVGEIKNERTIAVAAIVGVLAFGWIAGANHDTGEINDDAQSDTIDSTYADDAVADTAVYSY